MRLVLLNSNDLRRRILQELALETRWVSISHVENHYPTPSELSRLAGTLSPEVVIIIDLEDPRRALTCADQLHQEHPAVPIIGVGGDWIDPQLLAVAGVKHRLTYPPSVNELAAALREAIHLSQEGPLANMFAFLPAKAGCGASTVTLNTAAAMSAAGKRTLVMEADLRSGVMSVMLNASPHGSTQSALKAARELDTFVWEAAITRTHGVDFLFSNRAASKPLPDWNQYFELLEFLKHRYDYILVDLPELVNEATAEVVRRACFVLLVTTQEVLSLKLAEQRRRELHDWKVPPDRVRVLLNRWHKAELRTKEVEEFLGHPVMATFPNDYHSVRKATMEGRPVSENSDLGRAFHHFAGQLTGDANSSGSWLDRLRGLAGKLTPA